MTSQSEAKTPATGADRAVKSTNLLAGKRERQIVHGGDIDRLRFTQAGQLIPMK